MLAAALVRQPSMALQALLLVAGGLKLTEQPTLAAAAVGLALTAHPIRFQAAPES